MEPHGSKVEVEKLSSSDSPSLGGDQIDFDSSLIEQFKTSVQAEKRKWSEYANSLKKKYYTLKSEVSSRKKIKTIDNFNYIEYLSEEDKQFLHDLKNMKKDYIDLLQGSKNLRDNIQLFGSEIENQTNLILQKMNDQEIKIESMKLSLASQCLYEL